LKKKYKERRDTLFLSIHGACIVGLPRRKTDNQIVQHLLSKHWSL